MILIKCLHWQDISDKVFCNFTTIMTQAIKRFVENEDYYIVCKKAINGKLKVTSFNTTVHL